MAAGAPLISDPSECNTHLCYSHTGEFGTAAGCAPCLHVFACFVGHMLCCVFRLEVAGNIYTGRQQKQTCFNRQAAMWLTGLAALHVFVASPQHTDDQMQARLMQEGCNKKSCDIQHGNAQKSCKHTKALMRN